MLPALPSDSVVLSVHSIDPTSAQLVPAARTLTVQRRVEFLLDLLLGSDNGEIPGQAPRC